MKLFFIKIFIPSLSRKGMFTWINISGLSVGLAVVLLICSYIFNEFSFDKSFTHHQRIYRANLYAPESAQTKTGSPKALAPVAIEELPGVETAVRIFVREVIVKVGNIPFKVGKFCWADEDFFHLFDRPFLYGSMEGVFSKRGTIAISETQAKVFFGDNNSLGEILLVDGQLMEVSAVYRDFPANSSFEEYHVIGHYMSAPSWISQPLWGDTGVETFCLLVPGTDISVVEAGMQQLAERNTEHFSLQIKLQPLSKIHLYSKGFLYNEFIGNQGDIGRVKLFSLLASIILLVACINYMNLSTARAQKRSKEIGVSKTFGVKRIQIIWRLFAETGMLTFVSFAVALVLALMALPVFNLISGQNIQPDIFINSKFLLGMLLVYLATTSIAASYPVLYMSGFAPITAIRQAVFTKGSAHSLVRKDLSVVQFSVAVILIGWVFVIQTQMYYANNKDMGYNVQNVIGISLPWGQSNLDALKNDFLAQASVSEVSFCSGFPFGMGSGRALFKNLTVMQGGLSMRNLPVNISMSKFAPETIDLLQLKLIAGTTLPKPNDSIANIIINRKAVEYMETTPEEIIGKRLPSQFGNQPMYVCGVVENFYFPSLFEPVTPWGLHDASNQSFVSLLLKVKEGDMSQQLRLYEEIFKKHFPNDLFEAKFPDLALAKAYEKVRQTGSIVLCFSILSILIACLGVFGLTAFMAEQRTKEIAIRKVFGASIGSIVRLFTDNYLRQLAISLVIALPVVWWIGNKYLEDYADRISLSWWIFVAAPLIVIVLTLCTVGYQAIRAAIANPVEAIKSE